MLEVITVVLDRDITWQQLTEEAESFWVDMGTGDITITAYRYVENDVCVMCQVEKTTECRKEHCNQ